MPRHVLNLVAVAGTVLAAATGCGGKDRPVPVRGRVTLDGQPLSKATVQFIPASGQGSVASGLSDADGNFRLSTFKTDDGALPGDYKVTVTVQEIPKEVAQADVRKANPKVEVMKAQKAGRRKPPNSPIPQPYREAARTPLREHVPPSGKVTLELSSQPH
jgi:hypothetical protein